MHNRSFILITLLCILTLLGGCKKKKQAAQPQQPAATEQQAPVAPETPSAPVTPQVPVAPVTPVTEEEPAAQPPVAEEPARPEIQTVNVLRMTVTVNDRGRKFSTPATLRWHRGVGAIMSIQPIAGIEVMRAEATPEKVTIINKIAHSYTQADAAQIKAHYAIDLPTALDATIDGEVLSHRDEPVIRLTQTQGQTTIEITINTAYIRINENVNVQSTNIQGYKKVSAEQFLQTLL